MKNDYNYQKSFYFVGVCHGETEKVFLEELANECFTLKLRELDVISGSDSADAPRIVHFDDELNIQTNELKNKLIIKLEKGDLYKKLLLMMRNSKRQNYTLLLLWI